MSSLEKFKNSLAQVFSFEYVTIPDYHHGFVTEFKRFKKVLPAGTFRILLTENCKITEDVFIEQDRIGIKFIKGVFHSVLPEGQYVINEFLNESVEILKPILIGENHIGIKTIYGKFDSLLTSGKHFINKYIGEELVIKPEIIISENNRGIKLENGKYVCTLPPGKYFANELKNETIIVKSITVIEEGFIGILTVNGIFSKELTPGIYFENQYLFEKIDKVDMRLLTKELKPVEIMTKDTVSIEIKSILVYQIINAKKAICEVENIDFSIRETIKSISHTTISEFTLDEIMSSKEKLSQKIKERVAENGESWGVKVHRIDIKDIIFNKDLSEAMSASAKAQRIADSKIIQSKADVEVAKLFKEASEYMNSVTALQMKYYEVLTDICKNNKTNVLYIPENISFDKSKMLERVVSNEINKN